MAHIAFIFSEITFQVFSVARQAPLHVFKNGYVVIKTSGT